MGSEKNWAAIGAIAGIAGACIALLAYADNSVSSAPPRIPTTTPTQIREVPEIPPPEPEPTTSSTAPVPTTSRRTDTTPPPKLPLPSQLPPGCEEAVAAINTYYRTAGDTRSSQAAAAAQARHSLMGASLAGSGGAAHLIILALYRDFQNMEFILTGMVSGDYPAAVAATNSDIDTLRTVCKPS